MTKTNKNILVNVSIFLGLGILCWGLWNVGGNNIDNYCKTASTYEQTKIDYLLWCDIKN